MSSLIAVVDYSMGNLRSVQKAVEHITQDHQHVEVTSDPSRIDEADRVIFPGQGAARDCMKELEGHGLNDVIQRAAREKPFLGICMGMQVLMTHSEENGGIDCMNLYQGNVRFFGDRLNKDGGEKLKIPHMGWNRVGQKQQHALWQDIADDDRFYFVHSYYVDPADEAITAGETEYGIRFTSALACANVFAVQFHPEKSAAAGIQLLKNFARWNG